MWQRWAVLSGPPALTAARGRAPLSVVHAASVACTGPLGRLPQAMLPSVLRLYQPKRPTCPRCPPCAQLDTGTHGQRALREMSVRRMMGGFLEEGVEPVCEGWAGFEGKVDQTNQGDGGEWVMGSWAFTWAGGCGGRWRTGLHARHWDRTSQDSQSFRGSSMGSREPGHTEGGAGKGAGTWSC